MAIKIPSKNIYSIENPKIRDNVIDNTSVEQKVVSSKNEFETPIHTVTTTVFVDGGTTTQGKVKRDYNYVGGVVGQENYTMSASYLQLKTWYSTVNTIKIHRLLKNSYIAKVYDLLNSDNENNIKYSLSMHLKEEKMEMTFNVGSSIQNQGEQDLLQVGEFVKTTILETTETNSNLIPTEYLVKDEETKQITKVLIKRETSASVSTTNSNITNEISQTYNENVGEIKFNVSADDLFVSDKPITILSGILVTDLFYEYSSGGSFGRQPPSEITLSGTKKTYTPKNLEITINGDTIGIDLTDGSVTYGNGKKPFTLSGNELLQDSGKVKVADRSGNIVEKQLTEHLGNGVLNQYLKGKETATLLCDFNNYYDTDGNLRISTNCKNMFDTEQLKRHQRITVEDDGTLVGKVENDSRPINYANADIYLYLRKGTYSIQLEDITIASEYSVIRILSDKGSWLYDTSQNGFINGTFTIEKDTKIGILVKLYNGDKLKAMLYRGTKHILFEKFVPYQFPIGEKTIPYVRGSDGKDYPMSKNQDGSPKEFEVVGVEPSYDGAVWQKLFLLKT